MSANNNADTRPVLLESGLPRKNESLELIVMDSGLTAGSGNIRAEAAARDARPKMFDKKAAGLTRILQNLLYAKADGVLSQCFGGSKG